MGCLIPAERYSLSLEFMTINKLLMDGLLPGVSKFQLGLLSSLMVIHDGREPSEWKTLLRDVALGRDLLPYPRSEAQAPRSEG